MISNDALAALILPWAKEVEPENYAKTLAVAARPASFRAFLVRLVERRCVAEPAWRRAVPLTVLEETSLVVSLRHGERTLDVRGARAEGPRRWGFAELAIMIEHGATGEDLLQIELVKDAWDMELVDVDGPKLRRRNATKS